MFLVEEWKQQQIKQLKEQHNMQLALVKDQYKQELGKLK
jgi:hypothetical protein